MECGLIVVFYFFDISVILNGWCDLFWLVVFCSLWGWVEDVISVG